MKHSILITIISLFISLGSLTAQNDFYSFVVKDINGNDFAFSQLKGKKVMVINVASKCGFTPQYEALETIYKEFKDKNFVIVAFPANNFMHQEPGSNEEIKSFCILNYGVSFPIMSKISVKGKDIHPVYQWLTEKDKNTVLDSKVKWNFQKYLINEKGELVKKLKPSTKPNSQEILDWINN